MSLPLAHRSVQQDQYGWRLATIFGPEGMRIFNPSESLAADADIIEKVIRDPNAQADVEQLCHMVAGTAWSIEPGGADKYSEALAVACQEAFDVADLNIHEARFEAAKAILTGQEFFYPEVDIGSPRRRWLSLAGSPPQLWWVPTHLRDCDRRRFRYVVHHEFSEGKPRPGSKLQVFQPRYKKDSATGIYLKTEDGNPIIEAWEYQDVKDPAAMVKHVYSNEECRIGYGRGLVESIHQYLYFGDCFMQYAAEAAERYGAGVLVAKIDSNRPGSVGRSNDEIATSMRNTFRNARSRHTVVIGKEEEAAVLEPAGTGYEMIMRGLEWVYRSITRCILGSLLPTGAAGTGDTGSRALGDTQAASTNQRIRFHQKMLDRTFSRDLIGIWMRQNRAQIVGAGLGEARPPKFVTVEERGDDPLVFAQLVKAGNEVGAPTTEEEWYERTGIRKPKPGEKTLQAPKPEPAFPFGGSPFGGSAGPQGPEPKEPDGRDEDEGPDYGTPGPDPGAGE